MELSDRQKKVLLVIGVIVAAVVAFAVWSFLTYEPNTMVELPRDQMLENDPIIGSPNATVVAAVWTSFGCSYCQNFEDDVIPTLASMTGEDFALVFKSYVPTRDGYRMASLDRCAYQQFDQETYLQWRSNAHNWTVNQSYAALPQGCQNVSADIGPDRFEVQALMGGQQVGLPTTVVFTEAVNREDASIFVGYNESSDYIQRIESIVQNQTGQ